MHKAHLEAIAELIDLARKQHGRRVVAWHFYVDGYDPFPMWLSSYIGCGAALMTCM